MKYLVEVEVKVVLNMLPTVEVTANSEAEALALLANIKVKEALFTNLIHLFNDDLWSKDNIRINEGFNQADYTEAKIIATDGK